MTEPAALPPPETPPETSADPAPETPPSQPPDAAPPATHDVLPWLSGAGFLILAVALFWVWRHPVNQQAATAQADAQQIASLEARVSRLEQQPPPQAIDLAALTARVTALEQRPAATPEQAVKPPDLAPLETRIATLEAKQPADSQVMGRIDALSARADAQSGAQRGMQSDLTRRLDTDDARLAAVERTTRQIQAVADRANRAALVQSAQLALDAGRPLGDLPGAPPALMRFATTAPPTQVALRQAFPQAARAAQAAAQPSEGKPLLARAWAAAQDLVTIRRGDRVLVGDPVAGVLERARAALDAGDLAGAAAAVASLSGAPAQAMAAWLADARALLDARAALADWAAHA